MCNREWEVAIWKDFSLIYLFLRENKKEETSPAWLNGEAARQKCLTIFFLFSKKMDENTEAALRQIIQADPDSGKHLGVNLYKE